jgi:hypothetical protein
MAQVTVELRLLMEKTNFKLFDFDYKFDDLNFKAQLEQDVTDYYYDYEIGFETPDMFKQKFKARWTRIMPYYNALYNTTLLDYDPLVNQKFTEKLDQLATVSSTQNSDTTSSANNTTKNTGTNTQEGDSSGQTTTNTDNTDSDYPQQPIAGGSYASKATKATETATSEAANNTTTTLNTQIAVTDSSTNHGTVTNNNEANTDYTKTIEGITGITYPELIQKHRDNLLRISDRIIEEMKKCFILTY